MITIPLKPLNDTIELENFGYFDGFGYFRLV